MSWFGSKTVRNAGDLCKHVRKGFNAQRDLLSPQAVTALDTALNETKQAMQAPGPGEADLKKKMEALEEAATKWLKPYPNPAIRENVEVLLVALAVAMSIRTFFLQPFKIPTGSMQPTLFGVTPGPGSPSAKNQPDLQIPGAVSRFFDYWMHGNSYFNEVAREDGQLEMVKAPFGLVLFNLWQDYQFNGRWYRVWFPPDDLFARVGYVYDAVGGAVLNGRHVKTGQPILRLKVTAGDHLFVDRLTYNFRPPRRGEIIVFETRGIGNQFGRLTQGQFYIKRMVALGGEQVQIGEDRHLRINGVRLDDKTPHFENVYSFNTNQPARESEYSGHVFRAELAPVFSTAPDGIYTVRPGHLMVMGDNTLNSYDSRVWGDFSRTNVVGKYLFVYWPFSKRFGWNVK
jgi:signal peptidase I